MYILHKQHNRPLILIAILKIYTERATAEENSRFWTGLIAALGGCASVSILIRSLCFGIAGQALTARLRKLTFRHILQQVNKMTFVVIINHFSG